MTDSGEQPAAAQRRQYVRAVGPRLRKLLYVVFALVAILGANSVYLASITFWEWRQGEVFQNFFSLCMFLAHLVLGLLLIVPLVTFGFLHILNAWNRPNRRAVRVGYALFATAICVLVSGLALVRIEGLLDLRHPLARSAVYWVHVACPLIAGWLYWLHRLAGPRIKWRVGIVYAGVVGAAVLIMVGMHSHDPRQWNVAGPKEGQEYFFPSRVLTATGNFIPADKMMMDDYCKKCHADIHEAWSQSVHHISSFNNSPYLAAVRGTRRYAMETFGNVKASRFCAGCHDPVPFLSGAFDDPNYDMQHDPTAHAGITCTVCHAITHVPETGPIGNADYTIEEPQHYPFAQSNSAILQWVNEQLVKAKPSFHKKTFLKPLHKKAEFCATCHKVHLPEELNGYKYLRGQNHYDTYHLSGLGHGARSFYYPPKAEANCNECHMPATESDDFGAVPREDKPGSGKLWIHDHLFASHNTAIAHMRNRPDIVRAQQDSLKGVMRVDIFGLKAGGEIDGQLQAPIRPAVPTLTPGETYLLETVIRTVKMGHHFTQGTVDSNEVWLQVLANSGGKTIARSGGMDNDREVDPWSHFVNAFVLDRHGNRIAQRNAEDIVLALYNNQIPPGAGQTVHYSLKLPEDLDAPVTVTVRLLYRKFDKQYMDFVTSTTKPGDPPIHGFELGKPYVNDLPVTVLAEDTVTFPVEGVSAEVKNADRDLPAWQRWNDYGIGLLLKGKAELKQAEEAFTAVEQLDVYHGPLNLARVYFSEGRLPEAAEAIARAAKYDDPPAPRWTMSWLSGQLHRQWPPPGDLEKAEQSFRSVLEDRTQEMIDRGFDFSADYVVINLLGETLFDRAKRIRSKRRAAERDVLYREAIAAFQKTLVFDSENVTAHFTLGQLYDRLGEKELAQHHRDLHAKYKPDENMRAVATAKARAQYPAANHAAERVVIYALNRPDAYQHSPLNGTAAGRGRKTGNGDDDD